MGILSRLITFFNLHLVTIQINGLSEASVHQNNCSCAHNHSSMHIYKQPISMH